MLAAHALLVSLVMLAQHAELCVGMEFVMQHKERTASRAQPIVNKILVDNVGMACVRLTNRVPVATRTAVHVKFQLAKMDALATVHASLVSANALALGLVLLVIQTINPSISKRTKRRLAQEVPCARSYLVSQCAA